jgi:hypothetical protein
MNESGNVIWMNEVNRKRTKSNNPEIATLVARFLELTRKDWLAMNEARDIDYLDSAYENNWDIIPVRLRSAEIIPLVSKNNRWDESYADAATLEYLNEKMCFFYNNGGPNMEL